MDKYQKLFEQSVSVQVSIKDNLEALNENIKSLNDKFVLHCSTSDDISKELRVIRFELLKFLKWAIFVLILVLGIFAGIREIPKLL